MAGLRYPKTILAVSSGSVFLSFLFHRYQTSWKASNIPLAAHGHVDSVAVATLNPLQKSLFQHRITIQIPASRLKSGIDNEQILARFTRGFFGGWVFSPERWIFRLTGLSLTDSDRLQNLELERSPIQAVWDLYALSENAPPPSGSLLFGNFLLAEKLSSSMAGPPKTGGTPPDPAPEDLGGFVSAEFVAGGSKNMELVSSHRFDVTRKHGHDEGMGPLVVVTFSHVSCNSATGRPNSTFFGWVHHIYSRLLFADGIRAVMSAK